MPTTEVRADGMRIDELPVVYRRLAGCLRAHDEALARVYDEVAADIDAALRLGPVEHDLYLTVEQVAERLQLSTYTVREKARAGLLAGAAKSGGVWRFRATDLKLVGSVAADARDSGNHRNAVALFDALLADRVPPRPETITAGPHRRRTLPR